MEKLSQQLQESQRTAEERRISEQRAAEERWAADRLAAEARETTQWGGALAVALGRALLATTTSYWAKLEIRNQAQALRTVSYFTYMVYTEALSTANGPIQRP